MSIFICSASGCERSANVKIAYSKPHINLLYGSIVLPGDCEVIGNKADFSVHFWANKPTDALCQDLDCLSHIKP